MLAVMPVKTPRTIISLISKKKLKIAREMTVPAKPKILSTPKLKQRTKAIKRMLSRDILNYANE